MFMRRIASLHSAVLLQRHYERQQIYLVICWSPVPNHAEGYSPSNLLLPLTFTTKFCLCTEGFGFDRPKDVPCRSLLLFTVLNEQSRFCYDARDEGRGGNYGKRIRKETTIKLSRRRATIIPILYPESTKSAIILPDTHLWIA